MKSKKIFYLIIFILMVIVGLMAYFEIGIFAPKEENKFTPEEAAEFERLAREFTTPNPNVVNLDVPVTNDSIEYEIENSSLLIPIIEHQHAEESLAYLNV